jgi:hypothetical protein
VGDSKKKSLKDVPGQIDVLQETPAHDMAQESAVADVSDGSARGDSSKGKKRGSPHDAYVRSECYDSNGLLGLLCLALLPKVFNHLIDNYTDLRRPTAIM